MRPSAEPQDNSAPLLIEHDLLVVGVPVFNEARYLEETLRSLERQSWSDFEVLIADNASSDESELIARQFCERDPRFHLHRHASNVGGLANFKFLRDVTRSPLFMWLGAHDLLHPDFLSETIAAHRADPRITVAFSWMRMIAVDGSTECLLKNDIAAKMPSGPMRRYLHAYRYAYGYEINHLLRRSAFDEFEFRQTLSIRALTKPRNGKMIGLRERRARQDGDARLEKYHVLKWRRVGKDDEATKLLLTCTWYQRKS